MVREWLAVAIGGMLGTLVRHALGTWTRGLNPVYLPLATLAVNVVGCLAIGWLYRWSMDRQLINAWWEVGIRVGILGGLTTFSSFGLEVINAWHQRPAIALAILGSHLVLGLAAVWCGMQLAR